MNPFPLRDRKNYGKEIEHINFLIRNAKREICILENERRYNQSSVVYDHMIYQRLFNARRLIYDLERRKKIILCGVSA